MQQLPKDLIMTPHPKEFDRLAGGSGSSDGCNERLEKARELARHIGAYIILKGHYSALCQPDGTVYFNPTGNPGMATAGSGDVLTGIITGLCARGYKHNEACKLGMYLHGLAGDLAARDLGQECMVASDIINYLPKAFKQLEQAKDTVELSQSVDVVTDSLALIPFNEWTCLIMIDIKTFLDGLLIVIRTAAQLTAKKKSLHQFILGHIQFYHCCNVVTTFCKHGLQCLSLRNSTGESVEDMLLPPASSSVKCPMV